MNWIEHVCEPRMLFLAWQAPDQMGDRRRWAVGAVDPQQDGFVLRYFAGHEFSAHNQGKTTEDIARLGYRGYPGFRLSRQIHREGVLDAFLRRLPPRTRPDFALYREHFRLRADAAISDFALLGCTEAKLPSDGFSLVNPLDCVGTCFDVMLEIAGYRYHGAKSAPDLAVGDAVRFTAEPDNKFDPNAVGIYRVETLIGYANRLQANAFHRWMRDSRIDAVVERINGNAERPRVFVFVKIRPSLQQAA